ncbi:hypothetical protein [Planktotalea sp.]|uniref:hypothetical protein n=1 Tax=Planktotalea sp. TaxID=2029877 RepID=UPI003D6A25E1
MTDKIETSLETSQKKAWQSLELKTLDIPTETKTGSRRLDPLEGFFRYRPS